MLKLLVAISLLGLALGLPAELPVESPVREYYFESVGIPEAARIKAQEEAINFDGTRIVGGSNAALGQYPYMGGLVITLNTGATAVCGSSLISNNRVVTAAHCWWDGQNQARQFVVVLGSTTLFSGGTRITSNNVRMHPSWNPANISNDVAVVVINWINFSNIINRIALASGSNSYAGTWAWAAGFGAQRDGLGIQQNQSLHHVSVQVITNAECQRWFGNSIIASTLCIDGSAGRSTCGGDSGGPLAINGNTLIGITSFGYRWGCQRGWPAAFARVTSFNSWINQQL